MRVAKNQAFLFRLRCAAAGVLCGLRSEHSLRFQCLAMVCVLIVMPVLRVGPVWWAFVTLAGGAVISAELFNTALEHLADHLHPETHPQIRIAKDCAAGAVLVAACAALGVAAALVAHLILRA